MTSAQPLPPRSRPRAGARLLLAKALSFLALSTLARAQGIGIEHEPASCLIADKHPRLLACFAPRPDVSRARVYFRAAGTVNWYFVEMASDASCFAGVLPKPRASTSAVDYYLLVLDRSFTESRTPEYAPVVVREEKDCPKGLAPYLSKAPVTVGSLAGGAAALPAGFAASALPGALVVGVVGGGAAVAGGAAVVAAGNDPTTTTTTFPAPSSTTVAGSPTTTLAPTTTTTLAPAPTTTLPGPEPTPTPTPPPPPSTTTPADACAGDTSGPDVEITSPSNGPLPGLSSTIRAEASDPNGVADVRFYYRDKPKDPLVLIGRVDAPPWSVFWIFPGCSVSDSLKIVAVARDTCGNEEESKSVSVNLRDRPCAAAPSVAAAAMVTSDLQVPGASGQVVVEGVQAFFVAKGASPISPTGVGRTAAFRVEATLANGGGRAGTWRFEVGPGARVRVVAGDAVLATPQAVVFRLQGRPGERVVFVVEPAPLSD